MQHGEAGDRQSERETAVQIGPQRSEISEMRRLPGIRRAE
jgi:hypothetical protein